MDLVVAAGVAKAGATAGAGAVFKAAIDRVERVVRGPARTVAIKALAALQDYQAYLEDTNERVSTFKTFANPTTPVSVLDHFVTVRFQQKGRKATFNQDDIIEKLIRPARIVISATAGFGKSMVMRYIALSLYEAPRGRVPLFLELRHLNRVTTTDLLTFIHTTYRRVSDIQIESLKQGLQAGAFVLLLDGFDELNHDLRPVVEAQILDLAREFPKCSIVVSGRPDDRFLSWRSFSTMKINPMSKEQAVELITRLDYDSGVKKRFIGKIKKGLFETHESFLSTPLLAILMLLTYEQNANIPDKIHLFYGKAFETLFHKHDALKEQYARARKSGLQVDEFEKVFSVFCLNTYVLEKTEFTKVEILNFIKDALQYEGFNVKAEEYLFDIEEAVCLVMREGPSYFFVHRSFQEYFTALFLGNCPEDIRDDFIDRVSSRYWDSVLPMLFDIASDQIEPSWVIRNVDDYLAEVAHPEVEGKLLPVAARFSGMGFQRRGAEPVSFWTVMPGKYSKFISVMSRFYPQVSDNRAPITFEKIEKFASDNWDNLLCEREREVAIGNETPISIKNVTFDKIPANIIETTGLVELANDEYHKIIEVRKNIDTTQMLKHEFLKNLFKKGAIN